MSEEIQWTPEVGTSLKESAAAKKYLLLLGVSRSRMSSGTADQRRTVWRRLVVEHPKSDWARKASFAFE